MVYRIKIQVTGKIGLNFASAECVFKFLIFWEAIGGGGAFRGKYFARLFGGLLKSLEDAAPGGELFQPKTKIRVLTILIWGSEGLWAAENRKEILRPLTFGKGHRVGDLRANDLSGFRDGWGESFLGGNS